MISSWVAPGAKAAGAMIRVLMAIVSIPVMAPAMRKGIKYWVNFSEYRAKVWEMISPIVNSLVGFLLSAINFYHPLTFLFIVCVY